MPSICESIFYENMQKCEKASLLIITRINSVQNIFVPADSKLGSRIQENVSHRPYSSEIKNKHVVLCIERKKKKKTYISDVSYEENEVYEPFPV